MHLFINIVIGIHIFVSGCLIFAILLHSGQGTGLSESFGGALPSSMSGTSIIEKNLNRITVVLTIIFAITSFLLYIFYAGK
jgi:preprotein translocase subunit SecG